MRQILSWKICLNILHAICLVTIQNVNIRQDFEKHLKPGLSGTAYLLLGLITWVHLLFAIQAQDVKKTMKSVIKWYRSTLMFSVNSSPDV